MLFLKKIFWFIIYPALKKLQLYCKHYNLHNSKMYPRAVIVHMTDSTNVSGLADRFKCFVSSYIIAKENNYDLKILHTNGFFLEEYLTPNIVDWRITKQEVSYGLNKTRIAMILYKIPKFSKKIQQWHIYGAQNIIPHLSADTPYIWHEVFWKLFKLSPRFSALLNDSLSASLGSEWEKIGFIAVHVRFLDFLEKVENTKTTVSTTDEEKKEMITSVFSTIIKIHNENPLNKILLFTDSPSFLHADLPNYVHTMAGNIGHISTHRNNRSIIDKAFIDIFAISKAKITYNIAGPGLYPSQFSEIGAMIGNIPFKRINREQ